MSQVVSLDAFRAHKVAKDSPPLSPYPPPIINDGQIFARNYSELEAVVFAVLKVREILRYHIHDNEEWQYHLLCLLDVAYHFDAMKGQLLIESCRSLKEYILSSMTPENSDDLTAALLICDLIEKSPARQSAPDI